MSSETVPHNQHLGAVGEGIAATHLIDCGLVLLDRNWRCDQGELDLVMREGDLLVVVEVKTRSSDRFGSPLEAVDERKAARLRRLAARWLSEHSARPSGVRIDLVGVLLPSAGPVTLEHVPGVG